MPDVLSLTDAVKRLLVGRPVHSERLNETLLPKRIALPVFASDALSSVAYAPDEVFLTLAVAGVAAYTASPWIGLAVVLVMLIVVASYRQNVHAYPRRRRLRGGHGQPRRQGRAHGRQRAARGLRADRRRLGVVGRAVRGRRDPRPARARGPVRGPRRPDPHDDEPARRPGVGDAVRDPHLSVHGRDHRDGADRLRP